MDIDAFIAKWSLGEGGAERANAAMYTVEMLQALGLPAPDPACATTRHNDYVFERAVRPTFEAGPPRRIDLYKRGCFLMEHKQSRMPGQSKALPFGDQLDLPPPKAASTWDTLFRNARAQAFAYVGMLPSDHVSPPFVIICDVARSFEVWADFSGTGRGYAPFPDRRRHRFTHADLTKPEIQAQLKAIWTDRLRHHQLHHPGLPATHGRTLGDRGFPAQPPLRHSRSPLDQGRQGQRGGADFNDGRRGGPP